jgi:hypothetical protein
VRYGCPGLNPSARLSWKQASRFKEEPVAITVERAAPVAAYPRELISPELFAKLVTRVMEDEKVSEEDAKRVVAQTLVFLKACAVNPGRNLSPTKAIDPGWHAFILHTEDYAEFCERVAGRFVHHRPICNDDIRSGTALERTIEALKATGYPIEWDLWTVNAADCHQCHATCHDSP